MQYKLFKFDDNFEENKLHDSVITHCKNYADPKMRRISMFAYYKMLEFVYEVTKENMFDKEISFEGKPHFVDSKIFFNISHEDNIIGVVVSDKECGIDVCRKVTNLKLANKILSPEELVEFEASSNKEEFIARKWAMKEAYAKKQGTGLNEKIFNTTVNIRISEVKYQDKTYYLCLTEE